MGTTLGSGSGLDQDKTLACRTFGTPPHRPQELLGRWRDLRKTKDDAQDDSHARRHTHRVLPTVLDHCTPAIRGKDDDFHDPLCMYTVPPCVYKRRRWAFP